MRILKIALVLCLVACLSSFSYKIKKASSNARKPVNRDIIAELTKHQWSVAEYTETINDTSNNTTLMLMPCEKDNFLKFNPDNTYQIFEGSSKCNTADQDIKAQGTWEYSEADNVIVERFSGGRGIEKKILELNEGLLKIQFELEAKKIVTITYLSELGKKDETKKDQFVDNSDPCSYILQLIRENLIEQGKFSLVGLKNFKDGVAPAHPGSSKRIVVYPFSDLSKGNEEVDPGATKDMLLDLGKKALVDYVITGSLIRVKTQKGNDGSFSSELKYAVTILNVNKEKDVENKMFEYPEPPKKSFGSKFLKTATDIAPSVITVGAMSGNRAALNALYKMNYYTYTNNAYSTTSTLFSAVNNVARKENIQTSLSVLESIDKTKDDLEKFLKKKID